MINMFVQMMNQISVISNKPVTNSRFIKLNNVEFMQNGKLRSWDYVTVCSDLFPIV